MLLCARSALAAPDDTQLRVVILAVNDFSEGSSFRDASLDAEILKAGQELADYFQKRYGVSPAFLHTGAETSSAALKSWLGDYFRTTQRTITLVFVLTHGVPFTTTANTVYNSELYLATSDASQATIGGVGLKARAELLNYFRTLPNGSSVFLFLDACEAGSVGSEGLKRDLDTDRDHKVMILVSSKANQQSYEARFTRTLERLWEASPPDPCTHEPVAVESLITKSMDKFFPLKISVSTKQEVKMVRKFSEDFCFESFSADRSLLLVTNPSTNHDIEVSWREEGDLQDSDPMPVGANAVVPLWLLRKNYRVHFNAENGQSITKAVDLSSSPFARLFVADASDNVTITSNLAQKSLEVLQQTGAGAEYAKDFVDAVGNEISATSRRRAAVATEADSHAASMDAQVGEIAQRDRVLVAEARSRQQQADEARAEATACCRRVIAGVSIVDSQALQQVMEREQQAEQSSSEIEQQRRQLATQRAQAELGASQARLEVSRAQAQLGEAQSALKGFEDTVRRNSSFTEQIQSGQRGIADKLSNTVLRAARTDRGIVISIPKPLKNSSGQYELSPDLMREIFAFKARLLQLLPDAFIEVEVYSEPGDEIAARSLADEFRSLLVGSSLAASGFRSQDVVARGFGRVPVFENGRLTHAVPSGVQIVISSAAIGYASPVLVH
jgi:hypothetical protein